MNHKMSLGSVLVEDRVANHLFVPAETDEFSADIMSASEEDQEELPEMPPKGKYTCPFPGCGKTFSKPSKLQQHERSHTGERPFKCTFPGCTKAYTRSDHLSRHALSHASTQERRKPHVCTHEGCGKSFATQYKLKRHMVVHEGDRPHFCTHQGCNQRFRKRSELKTHLLEHDQDAKLYKCEVEGCGKSFARKQQLEAHTKTHNGQRYRCGRPNCDYTTNKWTLLQSHIKEAHPIQCPVCMKTFTRSHGLKQHMETAHSEDHQDKTVSCPHCQKSLSSRKSLDVHIRTVHLNERPFKCDVCGKGFGHKHLLVRHKRLHVDGDAVVGDDVAENVVSEGYASNSMDITHMANDNVNSVNTSQSHPHPSQPEPTSMASLLTGHEYIKSHPYACTYTGCKKRFEDLKRLRLHLLRYHSLGLDAGSNGDDGISVNSDDEVIDSDGYVDFLNRE